MRKAPWILLIIALAVVLRLAAAIYIGDVIPKFPGIYDEVSYHTLAVRILDGKGYSFPQDWYPFTKADTPTSHWSFVYPLYLASVYGVFGEHPLAARVIQSILCAVAASLLIYRIALHLVNERVGLYAAALGALYGYFIYYNAALMTESFFIIGVLFVTYSCLKIIERPSLGWLILFGVSLGLSILLRQTALFLGIIYLGWMLVEFRLKKLPLADSWKLLVPVLIAAVFILPWSARNTLRYGAFHLLNTNSGYALYASTHPRLGASWPVTANEVVVAVPDEYQSANEAVIDRALSSMAMQNVLADPGRIVLLTLDKSLEYFKFWPERQSGLLSNAVRVASFGLYLPFMVWGLVLSLQNWRKFMPLYLLFLCFAGLHILSWPSPRYRLPSDALMMVFAGMAVQQIVFMLAQRKNALSKSLKGNA